MVKGVQRGVIHAGFDKMGFVIGQTDTLKYFVNFLN